jgi:hypothetical protein
MADMRALAFLLVVLGLAAGAEPASAKDAHVVGVKVHRSADGTWRFDVTVRSNDTGWKKYADRWEIVGPDGTVLGKRVLLHPHETEQPFTRSLSGVRIPAGVRKVTVRAHDKVGGYGGKSVTVTLPAN